LVVAREYALRRAIVTAESGDNGELITAETSCECPLRQRQSLPAAREYAAQRPTLLVRGLDCVDGTPLLDLKPDRTLFTPIAPPQPGDFETG